MTNEHEPQDAKSPLIAPSALNAGLGVVDEAVWLYSRRGKFKRCLPTMEEIVNLHKRLELLEKVFFSASRFVRTPVGSEEENEAGSDLAWTISIAEKTAFLDLIGAEIVDNPECISPADDLQLDRISAMIPLT